MYIYLILSIGLEIIINSVPSSFVSLKKFIARTAVNSEATIPINVWQIAIVVFAQTSRVFILAAAGKMMINEVQVKRKSNQVIHIGFLLIVFTNKKLK